MCQSSPLNKTAQRPQDSHPEGMLPPSHSFLGRRKLLGRERRNPCSCASISGCRNSSSLAQIKVEIAARCLCSPLSLEHGCGVNPGSASVEEEHSFLFSIISQRFVGRKIRRLWNLLDSIIHFSLTKLLMPCATSWPLSPSLAYNQDPEWIPVFDLMHKTGTGQR